MLLQSSHGAAPSKLSYYYNTPRKTRHLLNAWFFVVSRKVNHRQANYTRFLPVCDKFTK